MAENTGHIMVRRPELAPEQYEAVVRAEVERCRSELKPKALKWQEWKNQLLIRIETQFEARYRHWAAGAIERAQQAGKPAASSLIEKDERAESGRTAVCIHCQGKGELSYRYNSETGEFVHDPGGVLMNCFECHGTGEQLAIDWVARLNLPVSAVDNRFEKSLPGCEKLSIPIKNYEQWREFRRTERKLRLAEQEMANPGLEGDPRPSHHSSTPADSPKRGGRPRGKPVYGERLRNLRELAGLTQNGLAEACDMSVDTIQRGEAGERWPDRNFTAVADTLSRLMSRKISTRELQHRKN
jgi:hypothetical protein